MNEHLCFVGTFENYCGEKADKAWNEGTKLGNAKAIAWSFLSGVPLGLVCCGLELYAVGIIGALAGKRLGLVDKD